MHKSHKKKRHHRRNNHQSRSSCELTTSDSELSNFDSLSLQELPVVSELKNEPARPNKIYEIAHSNVMGRYIVASKVIKPGDVIISELPIVVGPLSGSGVCCIGCYTPIEDAQLKNLRKCQHCGWPICSNKCSSLNKQFGHTHEECSIFKEHNLNLKLNYKDYASLRNEFAALVPFRCLLLKKLNPEAWNTLLRMESHNDLRKNLPQLWKTNQIQIVDRIRIKWGFMEYTDEEIHTICGVLEVNAFQIGHNDIAVRGLYPSAFLLAHDCVPNTTHIDDDKSFRIIVRATIVIQKGQSINLSYANTLQGTQKRREHLLENKFFLCQCKRCSDPTELGTYASALKCPKCHSGLVLSTNPLDPNADWKCINSSSNENAQSGTSENEKVGSLPPKLGQKKHSNRPSENKNCPGYILSAQSMHNIMKRIESELENVHCNDIVSYEAFLKRYCNVLHPFHYHCLTVKHSLSQLYGKIADYIIHELSTEQLNRKIEICREILSVFDILEPGYSRLRGITLYELHAPLMILAARDFESKLITKTELKARLKEIIKYLEESYTILNFEPKTSSEGLMAEAAKEALLKIRNWQNFIGKI